MRFSECSTQQQQVEWISSKATACPFCGGVRITVYPPGQEKLWEMGCTDFACVKPRSVHKDPEEMLRRWNMRDGK